MEWETIEYKEEYREKVISLWIEICVQEFGFEEWNEDIKNMDNHEYKSNNGNFWLAINDKNEIIGTIAVKNQGNDKALLKSLYVKKEYRKNGIAKKLFHKSMEFTIQKGYKNIELETYDSFKQAIKFYLKNGFVIKQHIENQYVMEKDLQQNNKEV